MIGGGAGSGRGDILVGAACFCFRLGQQQAARMLAEEALAAPETPTLADVLLMLAMCAAETEFLAEAEGYYQRDADLAREIGYHPLHYRVLNNLRIGQCIIFGGNGKRGHTAWYRWASCLVIAMTRGSE
jgi:hypothetical protein